MAIHNGQVFVLERDNWQAWLDLDRPATELLRPLPSRGLSVEQVG